MSNISNFSITKKWPPKHPDKIQLYSLATPNGVKVSILLEEIGLPYESHKVNLETRDQFSPEFLSLYPNNKIPAILDPNGPDGRPLALFESGAIMLYLAEKANQFLPKGARERYEVIQWLMFQMAGVGPMFGQLGFFHKFAGKEFEDKRPRDRYVVESKRLLGVLEGQLKKHRWVAGDEYTIADMAILPWVRNLIGYYGAGDLVEIKNYPHLLKTLDVFVARPAVKRGLVVPN